MGWVGSEPRQPWARRGQARLAVQTVPFVQPQSFGPLALQGQTDPSRVAARRRSLMAIPRTKGQRVKAGIGSVLIGIGTPAPLDELEKCREGVDGAVPGGAEHQGGGYRTQPAGVWISTHPGVPVLK